MLGIAFEKLTISYMWHKNASNQISIFLPTDDTKLKENIIERVNFYTFNQAKNIKFVKKYPIKDYLSSAHVLYFGSPKLRKLFSKLPFNYLVDHRNFVAGWEWIKFSNDFNRHTVDINHAFQNFEKAFQKYNTFDKAYIFGTGPSLSKAIDKKWSDGLRIVCNTIVKDKELFDHINPHFIVAGDAVYHYSHTRFAKQFRKDLFDRMSENHGLYFAYPSIFDVLIRKDFSQFESRLIPIPSGGPKKIDVNLFESFKLPQLGNILALMLLPLALSFSKKVLMIGFDGRDPRDQKSPFWANSEKHSYPELMWTLKSEFPAFFNHFVPNNNAKKYIKSVHEDLDSLFLQVEKKGILIEMIHPSWTETLNKRYLGNQSRETYFR